MKNRIVRIELVVDRGISGNSFLLGRPFAQIDHFAALAAKWLK